LAERKSWKLGIRTLFTFACKRRTKISRYFFLKEKVFSFHKQVITWLENHSGKNYKCQKIYLFQRRWNS
jgi:hypothetical protein